MFSEICLRKDFSFTFVTTTLQIYKIAKIVVTKENELVYLIS